MDPRVRELHDEALALMPEGAEHDESDCPICASETAGEDHDTAQADHQEGKMSGTTTDALSKETHDALLRQAVEDATAALSRENESLTEQVEALTEERDEAQSQVTELKGETERLNGELDSAQVALTTAEERASELEAEITKRDEQARLREIADERAKQVRNLGLFAEDDIDEKAQRWASLDDEAWSERVEEWRAIKGASGDEQAQTTTTTSTETASAITGTSEGEEEQEEAAEEKTSARRQVLGLPATKTA